MNKKVFISIVIIIMIVVAAWMYSGFKFNGEQQLPTPIPEFLASPFPLNDPLAAYQLEKLGNRFALIYTKSRELPISIYVSKDTNIPLENYLTKDIILSGEFITEMQQIQCIQAPCNPIFIMVVRLDSVAVK